MGSYHSALSGRNTDNLWDDFWKKEEKRGIYPSWAKMRILKILSDYIKPGMDVLDAGCGSGFFSSYFISSGCNAYLLDYSGEALAVAKNTTAHRGKRYIKGDILNREVFSDTDRKFDIIFTDGLFEHYSDSEQDVIIENLKGIKKKDGHMMNFVPNMFSIWTLARPFFMNIKEAPFTMSRFLRLHERNSLEIDRSGGINVLPFRISPERLLGRYFGMLFYCIAK